MTGEIGLCRNQSIKVYTEELLQIITDSSWYFSSNKKKARDDGEQHIVDD